MNYACKNKNNPINQLPKNYISRGMNRPSQRWKPVASGWLVFRDGNVRFDYICETWINWSYILNCVHSGMSEIVLSHEISKSKNYGYFRKYPSFSFCGLEFEKMMHLKIFQICRLAFKEGKGKFILRIRGFWV